MKLFGKYVFDYSYFSNIRPLLKWEKKELESYFGTFGKLAAEGNRLYEYEVERIGKAMNAASDIQCINNFTVSFKGRGNITVIFNSKGEPKILQINVQTTERIPLAFPIRNYALRDEAHPSDLKPWPRTKKPSASSK